MSRDGIVVRLSQSIVSGRGADDAERADLDFHPGNGGVNPTSQSPLSAARITSSSYCHRRTRSGPTYDIPTLVELRGNKGRHGRNGCAA